MNAFIKKNSKLFNSVGYIGIGIALIGLHWNMSLSISDDETYINILRNMSLWQYIRDTYINKNGKVFTDIMPVILTHIPIIFKSINILMFECIGFYTEKIFVSSWGGMKSCIFPIGTIVVLFYPFDFLLSAGYCATSTNYIWTTTMLLVSLSTLINNDANIKHKWLFLLAALYTSGQEQAAIILLTTLTLYICKRHWDKERVKSIVYTQWFTVFLGMIFMILSPGHRGRGIGYSIFRAPDFLQLSAFQKLMRGITSTTAHFLNSKNCIWPLLCLMLFLVMIERKRFFLETSLSGVIFLFCFISGPLNKPFWPRGLKMLFNWSPEWGYSMWDYRPINAVTYMDWKYYIPIIISITIVGTVFLEIFWIFQKEAKGTILFLCLAAGFCSRIIMGFSPTVYGSSFRTFTFCYFGIGICICILYKEILSFASTWIRYIAHGAILLAIVVTYYNSFMSIR